MEKAGEAELIIAKQRNGPVGEIPLTFLKEYTRFETRARNVSETEERFRVGAVHLNRPACLYRSRSRRLRSIASTSAISPPRSC